MYKIFSNFFSKRTMWWLCAASLAGCATSPSQLGISQSQWAQYSPEKRNQIVEGYKATQSKKTTSTSGGDSVLSVKIQDGRALMPPFVALQTYQPIAFQIKDGQCGQAFSLVSKENPEQKTTLGVCYTDDVLYLDPSAYNPDQADGSLQFHSMPIWTRGFTYPNVTSAGYAKLTDVKVSVHAIASDPRDSE